MSAPVLTLLKTARGRLSHISCCRRIGKFRVKGEVSMKGRNQHVTMRSDGNWQIKGEGACRASFVTTTQSEAIKLGRRHLLQSRVGVDRPSSRWQNPRKGFPWPRPLPTEGIRGPLHARQRPVISRPLSLNDFFIVAK